MRLLIVDDDPFVATALERQLRRHFRTIALCGSATDALALVARDRFDVVLVDQQLGADDTGDDFLQVLAVRFPALRRVLMSGGDMEHGHGAAHAVVPKPAGLEELVAALTPPTEAAHAP